MTETGSLRFKTESKFTPTKTLWIGSYAINRAKIGEFSIAFDSVSKIGAILQIQIEEHLQGKGFGRDLVRRLERFLKSKGALTFVADAVRDSAIGFWTTMGYEMSDEAGGQMFKPAWATRGVHY